MLNGRNGILTRNLPFLQVKRNKESKPKKIPRKFKNLILWILKWSCRSLEIEMLWTV